MKKPKLFVDMDGVLVEWNIKLGKFAKEIYKPGYFRDRPAYPLVTEAIRQIIVSGAIEVYSLSAAIDESHVIPDKDHWLSEHIPEIDDKHRIFCRCGENKAEMVRSVVGKFDESCVLLDDYSINLHDWEKSGGTAVKLLNGINGNNGTWQGVSVSRFAKDPVELKNKLLTAIVLAMFTNTKL